MNSDQVRRGSILITKASELLSFSGRHSIASAISVALPVLTVIVTYFALLVTAIVYDGALGSPIALPLLVLFTLIISLAYTAILLFPAVAIAEIASRPFRKWQHVIQIPLSTVALTMLIAIVTAISETINRSRLDIRQWFSNSVFLLLVMAVPLGVYWWTMKFSQAIMYAAASLTAWVWRKMSGKVLV